MADINVERKGPSIWPWVIGLLVLALLIWAIAEMVDTDEPAQVAEQPVEEVVEPPAAVPEPGTTAEIAEFDELLPIGVEDTGRQVIVEGEIVGQPQSDGFWVNMENDHVIWVQAPAISEERQPIDVATLETGQTIDVLGTVEELPGDQAQALIENAQLRNEDDFADWNVHSGFMITQGTATGTTTPGTQRTPQAEGTRSGGMQSGQSGQGGY